MTHLLLIMALLLPPNPAREPLDPPGTCIGQISDPGDDYTRAWMGLVGEDGWRLWASRPVLAGVIGDRPLFGTVSLTESVTLAATDREANAQGFGPFMLYACAPGDLPPGGGWRVVLPFVVG